MKSRKVTLLFSVLALAVAGVGFTAAAIATKNALPANAQKYSFNNAYVKGSFDNWTEQKQMSKMNSNEWELYWYVTSQSTNFEFKFIFDSTWAGGDKTFTKTDTGLAYVWNEGGNLKIQCGTTVGKRMELRFHVYKEYSGDTQVEVFQKDAYTVTFDSDGGSAVSSKEVGTGTSIAEPTAPTKSGYIFTGWYDGSTKVTFPYTVNANKTLKAHWAVPTVTIGSTVTAQTMSYDSDNNQFYIHPVALAHGDAVSFQLDGADLPYQDGSATNLVNHKVVVDIADGGVYLKNESGTWKAYVPGYSDRQFVINDIHYATQTKSDVNPYEYVLYGVELNAGDTVKAAYQGGDAYSLGIQNEGRSVDFDKDAGDKVTSVNTHGVYDLYLKSNDTVNYDYFYAAYSTNFNNAFNYVNQFVDGFKAICKESEQTSEYVETLRTKWNEMNTTYTSLDQAAKDYILDEDDNFKFVEFYEDYDYICGKYNFTNFLGRTLPQSLSKGILLGNNESTSVGAIVITSLATITAGLGFAYYKKRKSN